MHKPKTILITGGAKRVGRVLCMELAHKGHEIVVHFNSAHDEAQSLVQEIRRSGLLAHCIGRDLSKDPSALISSAEGLVGSVDCVINNASLFQYDDVDSFTLESLQSHMQVNFMAPIALQMALMHSKKSRGETGQVIHVLDQKLINPNIDYFSYTLSREALFSSLRFSAMACAPTLRINALLPGHMFPSEGMSESEFKRIQAVAALGKSNSAEDLARAAHYFIEASSVTGQWLAVDGGCHLIPSLRDVAFKG